MTFVTEDDLRSWGRVIKARQEVARPRFADQLGDLVTSGGARPGKTLAIGLRRSYGDSNLNPDGSLIAMEGLDRVHSFDPAAGILRADAGLSLDALIRITLPHGLFPPVVPGTRFVTLGGAIANDVHGKNHHVAGTFGNHVRRLLLLRTDGSAHELGPDDRTGLFAATIGGLGLTGVIAWVEIALQRVAGALFDAEDLAFGSLDEFFAIAQESAATHHYTVAWIDCTRAGRGIFSRGNHAVDPDRTPHPRHARLTVPVELPGFTLNALTLQAFNSVYFRSKRASSSPRSRHYATFLFPLDAIRNWNRLYGPSGFFQYQCVVPTGTAADAVRELLKRIELSGDGSFLSVLKTFGPIASPGLLSFPREGTTLALDFRNRGRRTLDLLDQLDEIVREAGGRLLPAKDGRMSAAMFHAGYPAIDQFLPHVDEGLSSAFWRRVRS